MTINFDIRKNDLLKIWITSQWLIWRSPSGMARTIWFSDYPFINKAFTPDDPRNLIYAQSFRCHCPYKWKNATHYFPSLIFWSQRMAIFSGDIFLTFLDLTFSRQIPFLVFERVSTNTINLVSFWALRFRKIESRFGPFVSSLMTPESIAHSGSRNHC